MVFHINNILERIDGSWLRIDWRASVKSRSLIVIFKKETEERILKEKEKKNDSLLFSYIVEN